MFMYKFTKMSTVVHYLVADSPKLLFNAHCVTELSLLAIINDKNVTNDSH